MEYKNNCYWFVKSALEGNSQDDCFCDIEDINLGKKIASWKYKKEEIAESLSEVLDNGGGSYLVLELLQSQHRKDSQHVALITFDGNFCDQNWPDWIIRINENIENLFEEYSDIRWCNYYNVYSLKNKEQEKNIVSFISEFK